MLVVSKRFLCSFNSFANGHSFIASGQVPKIINIFFIYGPRRNLK